MAPPAAGRLRLAPSRALRALEPWTARILMTLAGLAAGWYGVVAGFVLGAMADIARIESRQRRRLRLFLENPKDADHSDILLDLAAAAAIALSGDWPGTTDRETRLVLLERFLSETLKDRAGMSGLVERAVEAASRCANPDLASLARFLAAAPEDCAPACALARWAYALAALGGKRLEAGDELRIRSSLADCGIGAAIQAQSRAMAFPDSPDPWTTLGLSPGASAAEVKRAYRRLSRLFHPDIAPHAADGSSRFNELREAYAALSGRR